MAPEYKSLLQKIKNAKQMSYKEKTDEELLKEKREMEKQKDRKKKQRKRPLKHSTSNKLNKKIKNQSAKPAKSLSMLK